MNLVDRSKLLILAMMSDNMAHHISAVTNSILKLNIDQLDEVEFDELWKNTNGHGGIDIDGKCSICLDFMNGK